MSVALRTAMAVGAIQRGGVRIHQQASRGIGAAAGDTGRTGSSGIGGAVEDRSAECQVGIWVAAIRAACLEIMKDSGGPRGKRAFFLGNRSLVTTQGASRTV